WRLFTTPTPGAANTGAVNFYEPTPTFSLAPGFYGGAQSVSLACSNASATIRYTTDGSEPTAASTAYTGPINVNTTTVIRAKAFATNLPSFTATNTYFINESHQIPVVSVAGEGLTDLLENGNGSIYPQGSFE